MREPHSRQPDQLDARLTAALEAAPPLSISTDFAAQVARQLAAIQPAPQTRRSKVGTWTLRAALALLVLAMFITAATFGTERNALLTESIFAAEFILLASWAALRPTLLR